MAFALLGGELASAAVRRLACEQLDEAAGALRAVGDADVAVHTARKSAKRLRALLRLVRAELGKDVYRRENAAVRDAARALAGARDHAVLYAAFDALVAGVNDPGVYADVRERLPGRQGRGAPAESVEAALSQLLAVRDRVAGWPLAHNGWRAYGPGLRTIYTRGAEAAATAAGAPTTEHLHEWRKSVKHLWHVVEILSPTWPQLLGPLADQVHALSDALGDDHDLALLVPALEGLTPRPGALLERATHRRGTLQRDAFSLGRRIYADKPKAFTRRLRAAYAAWEDDAAGRA